MLNTFMFDLDGTLLPMEQEQFLEAYFQSLAIKLVTYGHEPQRMIKAVWAGTKAMMNNDGSMTNQQRFWEVFAGILGEEVRELEPVFEDYYRTEFDIARKATRTNPIAAECIRVLKEKGYKLILATNPLFPWIATQIRILWAGLQPEDFELITTYENYSYCKQNLVYYKSILEQTGKRAEECIMVGNDIREDMCVAQLGMETYLLKDCMINSIDEDISQLRQGSFEELLEYIKGLPEIG